jgi:hypothetical protein
MNLAEIASGALIAQMNKEVKIVLEDIDNLNKDWKKARKITVTVEFASNENRNNVGVKFQTKTSLAPDAPQGTRFLIGRDPNTGQMIAKEAEQMKFEEISGPRILRASEGE